MNIFTEREREHDLELVNQQSYLCYAIGRLGLVISHACCCLFQVGVEHLHTVHISDISPYPYLSLPSLDVHQSQE